MYGFPPNVGAVGTAALLNVGKSLENLLINLANEGYNIGDYANPTILNGDLIIKAMKYLSNELVMTRPIATIQGEINRLIASETASPNPFLSLQVVVHDVSYFELKSWLGKKMSSTMEKQWGDLQSFTGFGSGKTPGVFKIIGINVIFFHQVIIFIFTIY